MRLAFRNNYNRTLSVAAMQLDLPFACGSFGGWATHGWWRY